MPSAEGNDSMIVEADVAEWIYGQVEAEGTEDQDMGSLERAVDRVTLEVRRLALERLTQEAADREELGCSRCGEMLQVTDRRRWRTVGSAFGPIRFGRGYGLCPNCLLYCFPADGALGLHERAPTSPRVQEICALMALRAPVAQAEDDVRRLTGVRLSASTLHREARRQGERALELRQKQEQLTEKPDGVALLAAKAPSLPLHSTMVIEIDAWNIRERDHWGQTESRRKAGKDPERWHWVYTATVFRLDQRATKQSGRPTIADRGYVATRQGLESFKRQLYAEALQRGLLQAETVLVLGDGAVWIWKLAADTFKNARQRLDLYHAKEHLWTLAGELYGQGSPEAEAWVRPYLRWLDQRHEGALDVIRSLEDLQRTLDAFDRKQQKAIAGEVAYLTEHKDRMDYKQARKLGQPGGSGAIESTCSQYQRRFKLTGQFWSLAGDEALLALATLHRNRRWHLLFPHDNDRT
jgi:hypothetical protein